MDRDTSRGQQKCLPVGTPVEGSGAGLTDAHLVTAIIPLLALGVGAALVHTHI